MKKDVINISLAAACCASFMIGLIGWNTGINGFYLLAFLPCLWVAARYRLHVFFIMLAYYAGASHDLLRGAENYFGQDTIKAYFLWYLNNFILAAGWLPFWKEGITRFWEIFIRLTLTFILISFIPPFSFLGIANPLTASGLYFSGAGIGGILIYVYLSTLFAYFAVSVKREFFPCVSRKILKRFSICSVLFISLFIFVTNIHAVVQKDNKPDIYKGRIVIPTEMGNIQIGTLFYKDYERHLKLKSIVEQKIKEGFKVIIFPEMVAGKWTEVEKDLWRDVEKLAQNNNAAVLLGVKNVISGSKYDNALVVIGKKELISQALIKSRISAPIGSWNPFGRWSATLNVSPENNGLVFIDGEPSAFLICYEQMLIWPVLQTMTAKEKPEVIIAVSNLWWAKDTKIPKIMENTTALWGRLFDVPVLRAVNT